MGMTGEKYDPLEFQRFELWLKERGCEVRTLTNMWECARFRFKDPDTHELHVGVIYRNKKDELTFTGHAWVPWKYFKRGMEWGSAPIESHPPLEAEFHKRIKPFLTKTQQGQVMGAFREVMEMKCHS